MLILPIILEVDDKKEKDSEQPSVEPILEQQYG